MGRYALGQRSVDGSNAAAAWELVAGAQGIQVLEIGVTLVAATTSVLGLGRPAAKGITPTTPVTLKDEKTTAGVALASAALAWVTGPTVPTAFLRRVSLPAAIGASVVWQFDMGLFVPAGGALVLWNLAANSLVDIYVVAVE